MKTHLLASLAVLPLIACAADTDPVEGEELQLSESEVTGAYSGNIRRSRTSERDPLTYNAEAITFGAADGCEFAGGAVTVGALEVPNKFTLVDAAGNTVAETEWLGSADYPGPWGNSLSTSTNVKTLNVTAAGTYRLIVNTVREPNGRLDAWDADWGSASKNCRKQVTFGPSPIKKSGPIPLPPSLQKLLCKSTLQATWMDGSRPAWGGPYTYPAQTFKLTQSSTCGARLITVQVNAHGEAGGSPNRFVILDSAGNPVLGPDKQPVDSGWIGTSVQSVASKTLSFWSTGGEYQLKVQTDTREFSDAWDAHVN